MLTRPGHTWNVGPFRLEIDVAPQTLEPEWRALERHGVGTFFQSYDWCATWCQVAAARNGETPLIVAGRTDAGELAFILPFAMRPTRLGTELTWLAQQCSAHNMGLYARGAIPDLDRSTLRAILDTVARAQPTIAAANFNGQPANIGADSNPFCALPSVPSPQSLFGFEIAEAGFEATYRARVSGRQRRKIRRAEERFAQHGQINCAPAGSAAKITAAFDDLVSQKVLQLEKTGAPNVYQRAEIIDFYHALFAACDEPGHFIVSTASHDGKLAASAIGVRYGKRLFMLMLSRSLGPEATRSPGHVVIKRAIESQAGTVEAVDLGAGWSGLKAAWHARTLPRVDTVLALRASGIPGTALHRARQAVEGAVRANPRGFRAAKAVLGRIRAIKTAVSRRRREPPSCD